LAKAKLGFITALTAAVGMVLLYTAPRFAFAQNVNSDAKDPTPEAPQLAIAQANPAPAPAPESIDPGPKFKTSDRSDDDVQPSPARPREPGRPRLPAPARLADIPDGKAGSSSIEARLDRLEKMVRSLAVQVKRGRVDGSMAELSEGKELLDRKQPELEANAKREEARAAEAEKRAAKQAEKASKLEEKLREKSGFDGLKLQMEMLHKQRDALQREVAKLDREIERIQHEHEHQDQQLR